MPVPCPSGSVVRVCLKALPPALMPVSWSLAGRHSAPIYMPGNTRKKKKTKFSEALMVEHRLATKIGKAGKTG